MTHYPGSLIKEIGADEFERRRPMPRKGPLHRNRLRTAKIKEPRRVRAGFSDTLSFTRVFDGRFLRCRWLLMPTCTPRVYPENAVRQQLKQANFLSNKACSSQRYRASGAAPLRRDDGSTPVATSAPYGLARPQDPCSIWLALPRSEKPMCPLKKLSTSTNPLAGRPSGRAGSR